MGGVFNVVNLHVYHYAANNPVKYVDPDGRDFYNYSDSLIYVKPESGDTVVAVRPGEMYTGRIDGAIIVNTGAIIKVTSREDMPSVRAGVLNNSNGYSAFLDGVDSAFVNAVGDAYKRYENKFRGRNHVLSGVYGPEAVQYSELKSWIDSLTSELRNSIENYFNPDPNFVSKIIHDSPNVSEITWFDFFLILEIPLLERN
jgi:hypothetical protein